ncbi:hypothetical protein EDB86DRAFT_2050678 [Lactarius hatsudake]|nr:hypothetical protein EDB86DRAFT_2050678 [Lactarius hatsudake]
MLLERWQFSEALADRDRPACVTLASTLRPLFTRIAIFFLMVDIFLYNKLYAARGIVTLPVIIPFTERAARPSAISRFSSTERSLRVTALYLTKSRKIWNVSSYSLSWKCWSSVLAACCTGPYFLIRGAWVRSNPWKWLRCTDSGKRACHAPIFPGLRGP